MARIVSWNIKQFSLNKWDSPTKKKIMLSIFNIADLVFVLEGPKEDMIASALADSIVQDLGRTWDSNYIVNSALGDESDSTLIFWKKTSLSVTAVEALTIPSNRSWDSSLRAPAKVSLTAKRKNYKVGVWHAPPSTSDKAILIASAWGVLKNIAGLDLFVGDFNVDVSVTRSEYASKGPNCGTVFNNPSLVSVSDWDDFLIGGSRYDKVLVGNKLSSKDKVKDTIAICKTPFKSYSFRDIYSVSDHCPITCVI